MKKISSKIIVSLLLAMVLWGGACLTKSYAAGNAYNTAVIGGNVCPSGTKPYLDKTNSPAGEVACLTDQEFANEKAAGVDVSEDAATTAAVAAKDEETAKALAAAQAAADAESPWSWLVGKLLGVATGPIGTIVMTVQGVLLQGIAIPVLSALMRISAALLELATRFTLSSDIFKQTGTGVTIVWTLVRDICNIAFIFILLWISIQTILGIAGVKTKKMVADVIVAALLINFSLFITKVVIDIGNLLGTALYDKIISAVPVGATSAVTSLDAAIMQHLGLQGMFGFAKEAANGSWGGILSVSFGIISWLQVIVLFVGFIVFMYAALLMIGRSAALIFLMAMSPIGFMGDVLPALAEYSKQWRTTLYGMVMTAPVFLLFVYVIIEVAGSFSNIAGSIVDNADGSGSKDFLPYFKYVMIFLLFIMAVKTTKKMTGPIGAAIEKMGGVVAGLALGAATGGAAMVARRTLGAHSQNFLNSDEGKAVRDRALAGDRTAQARLAIHEKSASSSYDFRNTKTGKNIVSQVTKTAGLNVNLGKGGGVYSKDGKQSGYAGMQRAEQEKLNKEYQDAAKSVKPGDKAAAASAIYRRDEAVKFNLKKNSNHVAATAEIERLKKDGVASDHDMINLEMDLHSAKVTGDKKAIAAAQKKRDAKEKELQDRNKERYAKEIADQEKIIKREEKQTTISVENDDKIISPEEKARIDRVERARNLAMAVRQGKTGPAFVSQKRHGELADGMESSKVKTQEQELIEELKEARRELKEQASKTI